MAAFAFAIEPREEWRGLSVPSDGASRTRVRRIVKARLDALLRGDLLPPAEAPHETSSGENGSRPDWKAIEERRLAKQEELRQEFIQRYKPFEWNRSVLLPLGRMRCNKCYGIGLKGRAWGVDGPAVPCECVLRAIFRECYRKWAYLKTHYHLSRVRYDQVTFKGDSRRTYGRKNEEFIADFERIAKRVLKDDDWRIFEIHKLMGADWRYCTKSLKMDRGDFFHAVYRIEKKLGRVFAEMRPYGIWPIDEYFSGKTVVEERPRLALRGRAA